MNYTYQEVKQFVEEEDVKFIRLAFCDVFGATIADLQRRCWISCGTRSRWSAGQFSGKAKAQQISKLCPARKP